MNRLDVYTTKNNISVVILNTNSDSNEYITCIPVVKKSNTEKIITKSGKPMLVDSSHITVIKTEELGGCVDSISEKEFGKIIDNIMGILESRFTYK